MRKIQLVALLLLVVVLTSAKWIHKTYDVSGCLLSSPFPDSTGNLRTLILPQGSYLTVPFQVPDVKKTETKS